MSSQASRSARAQARADRAAELLADTEHQRKLANLKRVAIVGGVLALVIVATVVITALGRTEITPSPVGSSEYGLVVGDPEAPAEVVIYEDFLCPACGAFEAAAGQQLAAATAAGSVVIDYRPISILQRVGPYSADSLNAWLVVRDASGDGVAKEFHDLLFADQPAEDEPAPDSDWLVEKAVEAGADEAAVRPGIESGARMDDVEAATQEATDAGVTGTPTVVLNGELFEDGGSAEDRALNLLEAIS
jgi:protein-disulfide isomerase